jgi:hypothetical protein
VEKGTKTLSQEVTVKTNWEPLRSSDWQRPIVVEVAQTIIQVNHSIVIIFSIHTTTSEVFPTKMRLVFCREHCWLSVSSFNTTRTPLSRPCARPRRAPARRSPFFRPDIDFSVLWVEVGARDFSMEFARAYAHGWVEI